MNRTCIEHFISGTVPALNVLFVGTVPAYNHFVFLMHRRAYSITICSAWKTEVKVGRERERESENEVEGIQKAALTPS